MDQSQKLQQSKENGELLDRPVESVQEFLNKNIKKGYENKRTNLEKIAINRAAGDQIEVNGRIVEQEEGYINRSAELGEFETKENENMNEALTEQRAREEPEKIT